MLESLDHDSLVNILEFLTLSDIIESFAVINSEIYHLFNSDDHKGLIRLVTERILFSEEHFVELYNHIDKQCVMESILDEEEKQVFNCKYLSKICEEEGYDEKRVVLRIMSEDGQCLFIDDYSKMKCCRRLSFMNLWRKDHNFKNRNIELRYCVDHENKNICSVVYKDFLKLAESYEFSKDRIYKLSFNYTNQQLNIRKIYSKPKEILKQQKEIFLRDKEIYPTLTYHRLHYPNLSLLLHQETIENNVTISIPNVQDSDYYKNLCFMERGDLLIQQLDNINPFFHDMSAPNKCGDLRVSRKGDVVLWTISRKDIKQLVYRSMIRSALVLPVPFCILRFCTNFKLDWESDGKIHCFLFILDAFTFMVPSFLISDLITYRRLPTDFIHLMSKAAIGTLLLKVALSLILPFGVFRTMFYTYPFTLPYTSSLVSIIISGLVLSKSSFWYARSCGWFYKLTRSQSSLTGTVFNKIISWITWLYSLTSADHDTEERCAIN